MTENQLPIKIFNRMYLNILLNRSRPVIDAITPFLNQSALFNLRAQLLPRRMIKTNKNKFLLFENRDESKIVLN